MKKFFVLGLAVMYMLSMVACSESADTVKFHDVIFNQSDLSEETLEWLEWYNSLPAEKQLAVSYIPHELYTFDSTGDVEEVGQEE